MAERGTNWLNIALLLGAGYVVVRYVLPFFQGATQAVSGAVTSAQGATTDLLSTLFPPATAAPAFSAGGENIVLPGGTVIPITQAKGAALFTDVDNQIKIQFFYSGAIYRTTSAQPDTSGNYYTQ